MDVRRLLRTGGHAVLSAALVLTATKLMGEAPAYADAETVLESPQQQPSDAQLVVSQDITLSDPINVINPGTTINVEQQCVGGLSVGSFCLGTSDKLYPAGSSEAYEQEPVVVSGVPSNPYRLPGHAMDWIVDEAVAYVGATRGLEADDLVRAYARPDIRAYVVARIENIVNKKLYGEPMDFREEAAYTEIEALAKDRLVQDSKWALEEYDKWSRNPCGYIPPSPPQGSGLPAVPNNARDSTLCTSAGSRFSLWAVTNGTPPADTFDRWASYRHPTPAMKALGNTDYQFAVTQSYGAAALAAGYAAAAIAGVAVTLALVGMSSATATSIAGALGFVAIGVEGFSAGVALTLALSVAGIVVILIGAIVTLGVAIWQMVEDAKPGTDLRDRATRAGQNTDPLGITKAMPDYAALSFEDIEDPANADKKALIHTSAFHQQVFNTVHDWLLFRSDGTLIKDPRSGYNPAGTTTAADVHFAENGVAKNVITVKAPDDTKNAQGQTLSGYRVTISRGWLMVGDLVAGEQSFRPYEPRTSLRYLDAQGHLGYMSLIRVGQQGAEPKRQFMLAVIGDDGKFDYSAHDSWTYDAGAVGMKTATLLDQLPVTPVVNVIPSVQGDMVADHLVRLKANPSTDAFSKTGGQYSWTIERLDDAGNVVGTTTNDFIAFDQRFTVPGDYRAKVTYTWTGPDAGSASGRVEFTIVRPAAEVLSADIDDNRVSDGSLTLDLRLFQNTRGDGGGDPAEFDVDVDWADDGLGNVVSEHYDVRCADTGFDTCETGVLVDQPSGGPTNAQWSESPTFKVPDDQNFLPSVKVSITNTYGETITRVFPIIGEHRPTYATMTPYVEMPAGQFSIVDVVEVTPSDLLPGSKNLQVLPYAAEMVQHLPPGIIPDIDHRDAGQPTESWWLQLRGTPTADDIGQWNFYYPFEQETDSFPRRPTPALTTLEVVASTDPGYRGIIRGAAPFLESPLYRTDYPDYMVQAAQVLDVGETDFTDFGGTVMCKLEDPFGVIFDKPCAKNGPFPWPDEMISDALTASVYLVSATEPLSSNDPYEVTLFTSFLEPTVTVDPVGAQDPSVTVRLHLEDNKELPRVITPPFSGHGFTVTCSLDGAAYAPCLDGGSQAFTKTPGSHALDVKTQAADGATVVRHVTWDGWPVLTAAVTSPKPRPDALKQRFDIAVGYGGTVAAPYAAKGFSVKCVADGKAAACDSGSLSLLRVPGKHVLTLTAKAPTPDVQSVTQQLSWSVATPKKKLTVVAPATARRGAKIAVTAKGLLPREKYVVKLAGDKVAKGKANDKGKVTATVVVPRSLGQVKVVVRGATDKRTGQDVVRVVAGRSLRIDPRLASILV